MEAAAYPHEPVPGRAIGHRRRSPLGVLAASGIAVAAAVLAVSCGSGTGAPAGDGAPKLTLAAYTTPREAYGQILPLFAQQWGDRTGEDVAFEASYLGSGAQSRAVVGGFEADVVALSLEADVERIADAGLIAGDWQDLGDTHGTVSRSVVVIAVREGNPKSVSDWADLAKGGLEVLTPDPKTSGGAQWNVLAMAGAVERGHVPGYAPSRAGAERFLVDVFKNVTVLDKGARESITNYEKGVGDVAITYENEVLVGRSGGQTYEYVLPTSTILIENPVAVVDTYADRHGTRELAEAFRDFLWTPEAQRIYADHGLRPVDEDVASEVADRYPAPDDLFSVDYFGGWSEVTDPWFGTGGTYDKIMEAVQRER